MEATGGVRIRARPAIRSRNPGRPVLGCPLMKRIVVALVGAASLAAFGSAARGEVSLTLTGVHNCCRGCANGIEGAITKAGATAKIDGDTVVISAADEAGAKKAAASLLAAGYFGEGIAAPAVKDSRVKTVTVGGVHLCCGKCVTAAEKAVKSVAGVSSHNAAKGAKSFTVEGDFSTKELAAALNKAGFSGSLE